jgi:hypothetical protein
VYFQFVVLAVNFGQIKARRVGAAGIGDSGGYGGVQVVAMEPGLAASLFRDLLRGGPPRPSESTVLTSTLASFSAVIVLPQLNWFMSRSCLGGNSLRDPENALPPRQSAQFLGERLKGQPDGLRC